MSREHLIYDNHARRAGMRVRKCFVTIDIANAKMTTMFFTAHVEQGLRSDGRTKYSRNLQNRTPIDSES